MSNCQAGLITPYVKTEYYDTAGQSPFGQLVFTSVESMEQRKLAEPIAHIELNQFFKVSLFVYCQFHLQICTSGSLPLIS